MNYFIQNIKQFTNQFENENAKIGADFRIRYPNPVTEYGHIPRQPHEIDNISEDVIRLCIATVFNVVDSVSFEKMLPETDKSKIHSDIIMAMMRAAGGKINPAVIEKVLREFT